MIIGKIQKHIKRGNPLIINKTTTPKLNSARYGGMANMLEILTY